MSGCIVRLIRLVLSQISPELRKMIESAIETWEEKAKETKTPWDDIAILLVKILIGL